MPNLKLNIYELKSTKFMPAHNFNFTDVKNAPDNKNIELVVKFNRAEFVFEANEALHLSRNKMERIGDAETG